MKNFTTAEIRDLLNRVYRGEISFSEMVEMINEKVSEVNEPQYKDGDFLVNEYGVIIIFKNKVGDHIYDHAYFSEAAWVVVCSDSPTTTPIKRHATEEEKKKVLDELAKDGKRWNAEKKCIEDIPKRKFKVGDRVVLKSGYKKTDGLNYFTDFDRFIGKPLTIRGYTDTGYVYFSDCEYIFEEDWLEPYVEDIPKPKFKIGDKVRIKDGVSSKTHRHIFPNFTTAMDELIGKELTVDGCANGRVFTKESGYHFHEDWLEPYVEELKKGDIAIFWDDNKGMAFIGEYDYFQGESSSYPHIDNRGNIWANAIKFESKEQYKKLLKREI